MPKQRWVELFQEALRPGTPATSGAAALDRELASCRFCDPRLERRFRRLVGQLATRLGQTIPLACQDWTNTKAAYRFLSNRRVDEMAILGGHFQATRERFAAAGGPILVLHDTTEFSYTRESKEAIGILYKSCGRKDKEGRSRLHTLCGILMHASLAVTAEGLPLGLAAIKFWTRSKFKGTNALKRKVNPTRVPVEAKESVRWLENLRQSTKLLDEPSRCIHIGDRESDIYELFCAAQESGTKFLVRTCVDRLAGDGRHTIAALMRRIKVKAIHQVEVRDAKGTVSQATVKVKYHRLRVYPPIAKQKQYPPLNLTVIYAQESSTPRNRDRIDWKLITNLPVRSRKEAVEKLAWYAMRWRIETFHKILKSGCRAEASKLRTAERIVNLIAMFCVLSWRIFWMTMMNRVAPVASPLVALTRVETQLLDRLLPEASKRRKATLSTYLIKIAKLGGYLARTKDSPPGNMVMWRGLSRLTDIELGFLLGVRVVGN
ncbi:MAG TPA: IS4 family transposase [Bryobacteraceae bacterium]|nr:IS4 family transposase [Bryobacteraceae bacterium]